MWKVIKRYLPYLIGFDSQTGKAIYEQMVLYEDIETGLRHIELEQLSLDEY